MNDIVKDRNKKNNVVKFFVLFGKSKLGNLPEGRGGPLYVKELFTSFKTSYWTLFLVKN